MCNTKHGVACEPQCFSSLWRAAWYIVKFHYKSLWSSVNDMDYYSMEREVVG